MTSDRPEPGALESQLEAARRTIHTDGYPMSIGELTNLYRDGELVIQPNFQRLFRWDDEQKSRLVESILLGIPLPSIFVAQDDQGRWELVDGLQRISTILQVQGLLTEAGFPPLKLSETKYLPALAGMAWDIAGDSPLSDAQKRDFKRAKIDVKIIKRESSVETKFDLFQRLNSFGSPLSAQEVRNALLAGVNPSFVSWLRSMAQHDSFVATTRLTDRDLETRYDEDLVLRFLWLHSIEDTSARALTPFQERLEDYALGLAQSEQEWPNLEETFKRTFDQIEESAQDSAFRKWNESKQRFQGGFLNTAYEIIAIGLGHALAAGLRARTDVAEASRELWSLPEMAQGGFATGRATENRLAQTLPQGRELMIIGD